jgi:hypothetical protein
MPPSRIRSAFVLATMFLLPTLAHAQADDDSRTGALRAGARSIVLPFPTTDGNASFGFWQMRSERTNLGLVGSVRLDRLDIDGDSTTGGRTDVEVRLGPALKRYYNLHPSVAGFGLVGVMGEYTRADTGGAGTHDSWGAVMEMGVGAEWFPFRRVSLGGTTGLQAGYRTFGIESTTGERDMSNLYLRTFTTAVQAQIYF